MSARAQKSKRRSLPLRFRRDEGGATAVEFGIIAVPFIGLLAAIFELGLLFIGSVALDNAMAESSRRIRTGELKNSPTADATAKETTRLAFRDEICDQMGFMATDCKTKLTVDVRTAVQFEDVDVGNPIQDGEFNPGALEFETGGPSTIVIVTAYYRWTMFMPLMNQALERLPGETLLTSATTFQTEPY